MMQWDRKTVKEDVFWWKTMELPRCSEINPHLLCQRLIRGSIEELVSLKAIMWARVERDTEKGGDGMAVEVEVRGGDMDGRNESQCLREVGTQPDLALSWMFSSPELLSLKPRS